MVVENYDCQDRGVSSSFHTHTRLLSHSRSSQSQKFFWTDGGAKLFLPSSETVPLSQAVRRKTIGTEWALDRSFIRRKERRKKIRTDLDWTCARDAVCHQILGAGATPDRPHHG